MVKLRTSIALATYQGERFLSQQLDSFLTQTRLPDEVCVSDDHSTDGTIEVVNLFKARAPFVVKVVRNPNAAGPNSNFEHASTLCTGDVICFSDQDDVWLPRHIEDLVTPMESNPQILAVASDSEFVNEKLELAGCTQAESDRFPDWLRSATMILPANQMELVLRQCIHSGHGMAFRRVLLPLLVPFSKLLVYDEWVVLLAAAAGRITYAQGPLTLHRQHQNQNVKARSKDLQQWATQSKNVSPEQERVQEDKWNEVLTRIRERRDLVLNFELSERAIEQKYEFVKRRRLTRHRPPPMRLAITMRELLLGRYHRFGRGFLTFARDLYGVRR